MAIDFSGIPSLVVSLSMAVASGVTSSKITVATLRSDIRWLKEVTDNNHIDTARRLTAVEQRVLEIERIQRK